MSNQFSRRDFVRAGAGLASLPLTSGLPLFGGMEVAAQDGSKTLTIASNVNLTAMNPTLPAATGNQLQAYYATIFDPFLKQAPDLTYGPGLVTKWAWNEDMTKVQLVVREGATWHNGDPVTAEDVAWSLDRAGKPENKNPLRFVWASLGNFKVDGNNITADTVRFEPTIFKWFGFLGAYVLPKKYMEKVGLDGFEEAPIGSGPYMVDKFERNSFLRLKANPNYWGGKPAFDTLVFKFVTDGASRVAQLESGAVDLTYNIPFEEYDRLLKKPGFEGTSILVTNCATLFITNKDAMLDVNVRRAAHHAIDKQAIVARLLRGYGQPQSTMQAKEYDAYDPSITVAYDPELAMKLLAQSGYSPAKPVQVTMQTTRGMAPKDFEMTQAIAGMWRKVGIEAAIEVIDLPKRSELIRQHQGANFIFQSWSNATGDPHNCTGFALYDKSVQSAWRDRELGAKMDPLWIEKNYDKRIAGWKGIDRLVADQGYIIPLLQYAQPIVFRKGLKVTPQKNEFVLPATMKPA